MWFSMEHGLAAGKGGRARAAAPVHSDADTTDRAMRNVISIDVEYLPSRFLGLDVNVELAINLSTN
jgi:hypothetical protein